MKITLDNGVTIEGTLEELTEALEKLAEEAAEQAAPQAGDWVESLTNRMDFTKGKYYKVLNVTRDGDVRVIDDASDDWHLRKGEFKLVPQEFEKQEAAVARPNTVRVGDIIVPLVHEFGITLGKRYEVTHIDEGDAMFIDDDGDENFATDFTIVERPTAEYRVGDVLKREYAGGSIVPLTYGREYKVKEITSTVYPIITDDEGVSYPIGNADNSAYWRLVKRGPEIAPFGDGDYVVAKGDDDPYTVTTAKCMKLGKVVGMRGEADFKIEVIAVQDQKPERYIGKTYVVEVRHFRKATEEEVAEAMPQETFAKGDYVKALEGDSPYRVTADGRMKLGEVIKVHDDGKILVTVIAAEGEYAAYEGDKFDVDPKYFRKATAEEVEEVRSKGKPKVGDYIEFPEGNVWIEANKPYEIVRITDDGRPQVTDETDDIITVGLCAPSEYKMVSRGFKKGDIVLVTDPEWFDQTDMLGEVVGVIKESGSLLVRGVKSNGHQLSFYLNPAKLRLVASAEDRKDK